MIIEYDKKYDEDIKELFYQLQEYIVSIDKERYNVISKKHKEHYFNEIKKEIKKYNGKMLLYIENNHAIGLIVGCINNEKEDSYIFKAPKRGRITEFVVNKDYRGQRIGEKLFIEMENKLKNLGCDSILIGVFGYNDSAKEFYKFMGYHTRMIEMIKEI